MTKKIAIGQKCGNVLLKQFVNIRTAYYDKKWKKPDQYLTWILDQLSLQPLSCEQETLAADIKEWFPNVYKDWAKRGVSDTPAQILTCKQLLRMIKEVSEAGATRQRQEDLAKEVSQNAIR